MNDCERFAPALEACVAGALDEDARAPLEAHCQTCADCRGILELNGDLVALAAGAPDPDPAEWARLRDGVLRRIAPVRTRHSGYGWRAAAMLAAASLTFVAGLWVGHARPGGGATRGLVAAMNSDAATNLALDDVENSRFTYSNVSLRHLPDDRVALDIDVTTHVQLVEPEQSPLVRDVLVHALLNTSPTGSRLRALSYAAEVPDRKVTEALIFSLHRDESVAVRLKALEILAGRLEEPDVREGLLEALRGDVAVQVRLQALEALAAHGMDTRHLRQALEPGDRPADDPVEVRLADHERRL